MQWRLYNMVLCGQYLLCNEPRILSSIPRSHAKKKKKSCALSVPHAREGGRKTSRSLGLTDSPQPSYFGKFQASEEPCLDNKFKAHKE